MDSDKAKNKASGTLRRSGRHTMKVLSVEPTPRGPLKRTRKTLERQPPSAAKGAKGLENGLDDEESPTKKQRWNSKEGDGDNRNDDNMEFQESVNEVEDDQDLEMDTAEDPSKESSQPRIFKDSLGDVNLSPRVVLINSFQRREPPYEESQGKKSKKVEVKAKAPPSTKEALSLIRQPEKRPDNLKSSMDEYKRKMEAKARSAASSSLDVRRTVQMPQNAYQTSEKMRTGNPFVNNIVAQKEANHLKKTDATKKSAETKKSSGKSCRGFGWYLWRLVFVVLLSSVALLVYRFLPVLQSKIAEGRGQRSREVMPGEFSHRLTLLQSQFPSQRVELWKRTKIHLEKHLGAADPTEPVSLILAAGRKAEGTLRSLAQDLASTYSFALNGSVLFIDGASKAGQGGDEVKLDIDNQLKAAFEGDKTAAIIHRFEELPPGSTLILYRYCDHETAAYKQVFILLTVLLPQDEISSDLSLKDVEETVLNYVQTKLVGSTSDASFNEMDNNKFGGLWSRISHVVLPVVSEEVKQD